MKDPAIRFRIDFAENNNLGPGKIALLEAVQATGSISDAARAAADDLLRGQRPPQGLLV